MNYKNSNNQLYVILICVFIYTYINVSFDVPENIILIYKNPIFKIIFLLGLYFFGCKNELLIFFLGVNYIGIGLKIQNQELIK
jgi:hypothetical protein